MSITIQRLIAVCIAVLAIATSTATAEKLPPGTYVVKCGADGKGHAYDAQGKAAGTIVGWPCPIPDRKIVITSIAIMPPPPSYNPAVIGLWGGLAPMQLVDLIKLTILVNDPAQDIDPNQFEPLETMPTLTCDETHLD